MDDEAGIYIVQLQHHAAPQSAFIALHLSSCCQCMAFDAEHYAISIATTLREASDFFTGNASIARERFGESGDAGSAPFKASVRKRHVANSKAFGVMFDPLMPPLS